jgi:hypothetical protein
MPDKKIRSMRREKKKKKKEERTHRVRATTTDTTSAGRTPASSPDDRVMEEASDAPTPTAPINLNEITVTTAHREYRHLPFAYNPFNPFIGIGDKL